MEVVISIEELKAYLHFDDIMEKEERPIEMFMVSVNKKIEYTKALEWISDKLADE